jgi:hypothetical protein
MPKNGGGERGKRCAITFRCEHRQDIGDNAEECANEAPGSSRALHFNLLALSNPLALSTLCIRRDNIAKKT